jgi:hypothetical protein
VVFKKRREERRGEEERIKAEMVRLTADLVWKSPHFFNAIKERELDLRGLFLISPSFLNPKP